MAYVAYYAPSLHLCFMSVCVLCVFMCSRHGPLCLKSKILNLNEILNDLNRRISYKSYGYLKSTTAKPILSIVNTDR